MPPYSQEPLVSSIKRRGLPGEAGIPECVETVISNVFLFKEKAYKFYKNDSEFFNTTFHDLSSREERHSFTAKDFRWNNASSPSIYTHIIGLQNRDGEVLICEPDEKADELAIVMNRVDTRDVLFERLMRGAITTEDSYEIGKGLAMSLEKVRQQSAGVHSYYQVFGERIVDSRLWIDSMHEFIDRGEAKEYCDFLEDFRRERKVLFEDQLSGELAWGGDIHSHNALYSKGEFYLMDTYSPKEDWLVEHWTVPAYRIATDLWALGGDKDYFEECLRGYAETMGKSMDRSLDSVFVLYSATIAAPYHYMLLRTDPTKAEAAKRLHYFIREYYSEITRLRG